MANILVVEDSFTHAKFIESALTGLGHNLSFAVDGEEAVSKLAAGMFDIVIMDIVMPKKNGFELCREMRSSERYKTVTIILISSKNQAADMMWGIRQGADEYITKPFEPERLVEAVSKHVIRSNRRGDERFGKSEEPNKIREIFQPA
jgi:DNA-binding response OmpR family regulator